MTLRERQRRERQRRQSLGGDLLWGAAEIAHYIDRPLRQTYYLIAKAAFPVHRIGARTILARKSEIDASLSSNSGE
jgi:hypothetical protein